LSLSPLLPTSPDRLNRRTQDIALVFGAGPMGLTTIQVLKRVYRVKQVIVTDQIDERLQMAKRNGADWTINNGQRH
jgi:L-gulonate 5-dehydrogenase